MVWGFDAAGDGAMRRLRSAVVAVVALLLAWLFRAEIAIIIRALAWPVALYALAVRFQDELKSLLRWLATAEEFKYRDPSATRRARFRGEVERYAEDMRSLDERLGGADDELDQIEESV